MSTPENVVVYKGGDEWSALYVDGMLDRVGDHYLIDERICELFGVEEISSDDFMRGGQKRENVAPTIDDLNAYTRQRELNERQAAELRNQAAQLIQQANSLDPEGSYR